MIALFSRLCAVLLVAALWGVAASAAADSPPSPFERPPGIADGDWKALSQALAKNVAPGQTLRPQDEATFGQGDGTGSMQFGRSLAVSGTTLVIGAAEAVACNPVGSSCSGVGAAYVYERQSSAWVFRQKLTAGDFALAQGLNRGFGQSVAIDGDTLLVGAARALDAVAAPSNAIGGVYVFIRSGGTWTQAQKLLPPTPVVGTDEFGASVALIGDTAVIGNPGRTVAAAARAGAVHVFTRSGGTFAQAALLTAGDGAAGTLDPSAIPWRTRLLAAGCSCGNACGHT